MKDKFNVTITEEISAVNNYLEIQKIRFQEKISTKIHIEDNVNNCLIPVFAIQTLVENAVKYGLKTSENGLRIQIEITSNANNISIRVKNTGKLLIIKENEFNGNGTNTGIVNLKNRLHYFDENYKFRLFENAGMVIAQINLRKLELSDEKLEDINR